VEDTTSQKIIRT